MTEDCCHLGSILHHRACGSIKKTPSGLFQRELALLPVRCDDATKPNFKPHWPLSSYIETASEHAE